LIQLTGVGILEANLARCKCSVDHRNQVVVEVLSAGKKTCIFRAGEVVIGAANSTGTARSRLKPSIVLTTRTAGSQCQGNELVAIERASHIGSISESLSTQCVANSRIEALQESSSGVLEDCENVSEKLLQFDSFLGDIQMYRYQQERMRRSAIA
jgi:hypothetical protein